MSRTLGWWGRWLRNQRRRLVRVLGSATLNKPLTTALLPPLLLAAVAGLLIPKLLHDDSLRTEALKQQGKLELEAVQELHALAGDFITVRRQLDDAIRKCGSVGQLNELCLEKPLEAFREASRRWDERVGYYQVVMTAYLANSPDSPEVIALANLSDLVNREVLCLYPRPGGKLETTSCVLHDHEVDHLESELELFSCELLREARRHAEGQVADLQRCEQ